MGYVNSACFNEELGHWIIDYSISVEEFKEICKPELFIKLSTKPIIIIEYKIKRKFWISEYPILGLDIFQLK